MAKPEIGSRDLGCSVLAGVLFGPGGAFGTNDCPQTFNGMTWVPLVVMLSVRALRRHRRP